MSRRRSRARLARPLLRPANETQVLPAKAKVKPAELPLLEAAPEDPSVDLVHARPRVRVDVALLRQNLRFAFESGDAGGAFERAVTEAPIGASAFDPDDFAEHLYLEELVNNCFGVDIDEQPFTISDAYLIRMLSYPPREPADCALRQESLQALVEDPRLRRGVERLYLALRKLRGLLDERPIGYGETVRRKIEMLETLRDVVDRAADLPASDTSLDRLRAFGRRATDNPALSRLRQLLDFERHLATVHVRLQLGADGRIRQFAMLSAQENRDNPLRPGLWRRLWSQLVAAMRGYRFGEYEVLLKLIDEVFGELEDVVLPCFSLIGDLEFFLAGLAFHDRARAANLPVSLPSLVDAPTEGRGVRQLEGLWNPLLLLQDIEPVAVDLEPTGHDEVLIITGPNSGGKTRLLQAVALTQLLGQAGLFVPARRAQLVRVPNLFVSLIDRASAGQKEGRLGSELLRVRRLFEQLHPGSMIALDELCTGTNPSEGMAIFEMVVELLPHLRPQALVTTHFLDAASRLQAERPAERLSFWQVELGPDQKATYAFVPGVATSSLAAQVAARLGVTRDELVQLIEARQRS